MKLKNEIALIFLATIFYTFSICKAYVMGEKNYQKQDHSEVTIDNLLHANKDLNYLLQNMTDQRDSAKVTCKEWYMIRRQWGIDVKVIFPKYK